MNNPNNLLNMMQTGGQASSAGGAALARVMQRQSDMKKLERQQRKEARRQKRGDLFGSIGSLAGGLLGAALAPVTGGASLALAAGLGAGLGKRAGEGLGAGKSKKYDSSGTVFGQEAFRDVEQASRDYTRGMGERALATGLSTALSTYLSPGGGMYGKAGGKLRTLPARGGVAPSAAPLASTTLMDSLLPDTSGASPQSNSLFNIPTSSFTPSGSGDVSGVGSPQIGYSQPLLDFFEDGGLAGYQTGGFTAQDILQQQGLAPTEDQLALFQSFDPTQIQQAKTGAEQSLMSMTGGMGLSSVGGGFGAKQRAATSAIGAGQDMIGDVTEQSQKAFESQTLGTAADLVAGGAEFGKQRVAQDYVPTDNPNWNPPVASTTGATYSFDGKTYYWDGNSWINQYMYDEDQRAQYDDGNDGYGGS